jgi:DNA-directed RNA polymerase specialized sigma24 family protein
MKKRTSNQKIRVVESGKDSSKGEHSPYWDDVNRRGYGEDAKEHAQANPDVLPEMEIAAPSTPQLLMGEAVEHLQGRQKECYLLTMREGKSFSEAAEILGIGKGRVQQYRERAIKFLTQYCKAAMAKGRV